MYQTIQCQPTPEAATRSIDHLLQESRRERIFGEVMNELTHDEVWQTFERKVSVNNRNTVEHCLRLAGYMYRATEIMGLKDEDAKEYVKGACYHDLGKAFVMDAVDYDGTFDKEQQFEQIRQHPMLGAVCASMGENSDLVVKMAGAHHRYGMDRSCLSDREMYVVQLLELFDSYDGMTRRNYNSASTAIRKRAKTPDEAVMELRGMAKKGDYLLDVFYIFYKTVEHELEGRGIA